MSHIKLLIFMSFISVDSVIYRSEMFEKQGFDCNEHELKYFVITTKKCNIKCLTLFHTVFDDILEMI